LAPIEWCEQRRPITLGGMPILLAMIFLAENRINYQSPLFWAVVIGWIISVTLHEFAHGLVAYIGGDYTIRERGGLTLNPLQYVNPMTSIILPIVFLLMGGIPLPGGATFIRRDLLRNRMWESAVSLAGPAVNATLFLACVLPLTPRFGWLTITSGDPTMLQQFLGASAVLQFLSLVLNLLPVPPLDGFNALSPFLPADVRRKLLTPPLSNMLFIGLFVVLFMTGAVIQQFYHLLDWTLPRLGADSYTQYFIGASYNLAMFGVQS
jgi:Zn-dependent protease